MSHLLQVGVQEQGIGQFQWVSSSEGISRSAAEGRNGTPDSEAPAVLFPLQYT